jgi:predicted  nucleic acid-binding Zn-ribbon protein
MKNLTIIIVLLLSINNFGQTKDEAKSDLGKLSNEFKILKDSVSTQEGELSKVKSEIKTDWKKIKKQLKN